MRRTHRIRLLVTLFIILIVIMVPLSREKMPNILPKSQPQPDVTTTGLAKLATLEVKGRAPKTGYSRTQFGEGWIELYGCDMRNIILARDLKNITTNTRCQVVTGTLNDPYTGTVIQFMRGNLTSDDIQIDHVVALSNAWQTGAQQLSFLERQALANDPLELLAVDGNANQQKSDGDAATWLPPNNAFRCQYVVRQINVKIRYRLWLTEPEKNAMARVLAQC